MTRTRTTTIPPTRSARHAANAHGRENLILALGALILAAVCGVAYIALGIDSPALPAAILIALATPVLLWRFPMVALYTTFGAACAIELFPSTYADSLTERVPFFWNVNTIFQTFFHVNFKAVPLNLFEVFIMTAGVCSLLKSVFTRTVTLRVGPLFVPIALYLFWVVIGLVNGNTSGGDFKIALQETRAQFYFMLVYLMTYNMIRNRAQIRGLLWTTAIILAIKGTLYTFRRYVTLSGQPLPDGGVGSHEEAFLFDGFFTLLLTLLVCGTYPRLRNFMLMMLPVVMLGNLATNRRAGTAALAILIPVLLLAAYRGLPKRRKMASIIGISLLVGFSIYYPIFKNKGGILALPARAIKSQFQPDERDRLSNEYRDAENADQMATIKSAPLGYGYGKHFLHAVPIADIVSIYEWWDLIPHNQILWVWMRTGTQGFVCFWIMIGVAIIHACRVFRDARLEIELRTIALFSVLVIGTQLVFGLLDLQLVNFRDMIFTSVWLGVMCKLRELSGFGPGEPPLPKRKPLSAPAKGEAVV